MQLCWEFATQGTGFTTRTRDRAIRLFSSTETRLRLFSGNVVPQVGQALGRRSIAIDLLGFGKSDKPNVQYTLPLHYQIVKGFIQNLGLKGILLVLQDWNDTIGIRFAVE